MDYELIWWCAVGGFAAIMLLATLFVKGDNDAVSADTLARLNGKRSNDSYIKPPRRF